MDKPWLLTTPDGLPPHLEQAWEQMRARCLEADAMERTLRDIEQCGACGELPVYDVGRWWSRYDCTYSTPFPTLSAAVAAWSKSHPEAT